MRPPKPKSDARLRREACDQAIAVLQGALNDIRIIRDSGCDQYQRFSLIWSAMTKADDLLKPMRDATLGLVRGSDGRLHHKDLIDPISPAVRPAVRPEDAFLRWKPETQP